MTNQNGDVVTAKEKAAERIEEARRLSETIGKTLDDILEEVRKGELKNVHILPQQVARLTNALADVRKKEADFNDQFGDGLRDGDIDFDALRREIGCRLNRIRRCCKSG